MTAGESAYNMNHRATRANYIHLQTIHRHVYPLPLRSCPSVHQEQNISSHYGLALTGFRPPKFGILKRMLLVDY
jgi:hypothetical protein